MARPRPELTADEERRLRALVHILEYFQAHEPQIPASMIEAFLLVALNEGCSLRDIVELSGKPQSTVSRHLLDLGERNRKMEPGLGLVEWRIAAEELRRKEYRLTPKGRSLLRRILSERFVEEGKLAAQPAASKLIARAEEKAGA
jgi:DNA-binding MarR family transcriptional regulator